MRKGWLLAGLLLAVPVQADGPRILDMVLTGMSGPSKSTVSRAIIKVGRYLYVSGEPGMQTIDAAAPGALCMTSDYTKTSAKMNGAAYKGGVLYVTNWHPGEGLLLFDVASNAAAPRLIRAIATPNYAWEAEINGRYLDVSVGNETKSGIVMYDVSDPRNPAQAGMINIDQRLIGNAQRKGRYMYFTQGNNLLVYDVGDPAKPERVKEMPFNALAGKVKIHRDHLYMLERGVSPGQEHGFRIFSLADPANPEPVAFWQQGEPRDISFRGDRAVVVTTSLQVLVLDASSPASPRTTGVFDLAWGSRHPGYPIAAAHGDGFAFVAATGANDKHCLDMNTCGQAGARVYSVQLDAGATGGRPRQPEECMHPRIITAHGPRTVSQALNPIMSVPAPRRARPSAMAADPVPPSAAPEGDAPAPETEEPAEDGEECPEGQACAEGVVIQSQNPNETLPPSRTPPRPAGRR